MRSNAESAQDRLALGYSAIEFRRLRGYEWKVSKRELCPRVLRPNRGAFSGFRSSNDSISSGKLVCVLKVDSCISLRHHELR